VSTLEVAVAVAVRTVSQSLLHPAHLIENPRVQIFDEPAYTYMYLATVYLQYSVLGVTAKLTQLDRQRKK